MRAIGLVWLAWSVGSWNFVASEASAADAPAGAAAQPAEAQSAEVQAVVKRVVDAVGGPDKLLRLFSIQERLNVSSNPEAKGSLRKSVLEPPKHWWLGQRERVSQDKEPATFLVWAWTLGAVVDPQSKVELLPDLVDGEKNAFGLRVSGTIDPPLDLYFDKSDSRLLLIHWRSDIHRFSQWKEADGCHYPARCVGYKKSSGKPWYFTEILELKRLSELPANLKRP